MGSTARKIKEVFSLGLALKHIVCSSRVIIWITQAVV